jgi:antitoxin HicB
MSNLAIPNYSIIIQWSSVDDAFVVTIPELPGARTHGATYDEALQNAREVIELVVSGLVEDNQPIPQVAEFRRDKPIDLHQVEKHHIARRAS